MEIHVYEKPGCPLCEEVREVLHDLGGRYVFEVIRHNILERTEWFEEFRWQVPVVVIGSATGIRRLALRFEAQELEAALRASGVAQRE